MGKNITLFNPPFVYFPGIKRARYNYSRPPLGLCYIAGYLRKQRPGQDNIRIIDSISRNPDRNEIVKEIAGTSPDIVGFSVVTSSAPEAISIAGKLREALPGCLLVAGGPHATICPDELAGAFDIVAAGEGEKTFHEIVESSCGGNGFEHIKGIVTIRDGKIVRTPPRELIMPLDDIPPPARELLVSSDYYHSFPYRSKGLFTTMFTTRGCPNNCYFCSNEALWNRTIRFNSKEYAAAELDLIVDRGGATLVFIDDDNFLTNKERAIDICEAIIRHGNGLRWICHACARNIDEDALKCMKEAGCVEIQIGVESGSNKILNTLSKCADTAQVMEKFRLLKKYGIHSWATFIIGHDRDTRETIMETINYSIKLNPTYASFIALLPLPGTKVFEEFKKKGYLKTTDWNKYTWHGYPVFETPELKSDELVELRTLAQKRFYLRPGKMAALLWHTLASGSCKEMLRNFFSWLSVIR